MFYFLLFSDTIQFTSAEGWHLLLFDDDHADDEEEVDICSFHNISPPADVCLSAHQKQFLGVLHDRPLSSSSSCCMLLPIAECSPPDTTRAHSSQVLVSNAPAGTQIPWDLLLSDTRDAIQSCPDHEHNVTPFSPVSALSRFLLGIYVSIPLHVHVPSLLALETLRVQKSNMQCMCWISSYHCLGDVNRRLQQQALMDNNRLAKEVDAATIRVAAAAVSSKPHWRKKGPMQWDVVHNTVTM
jgi:hypothetical protein